MRLGFARLPTFFIAAPVILCVCILELARVVAFQRLEWISYDWRVRLAHRYPGAFSNISTNLGLVEISDNTIAAINDGSLGFRYGLYWPREVYGRALRELSRQGAMAVAFDVLFAEERTDHPPVPLSDGTTISSDEFFARQIKKSGNVILAADRNLMPARIFQTNAWSVGSITVERDADGVLRRVRAYQNYRVWHPIIVDVAAQLDVDLSKTVARPGKIIFTRHQGDTIEIPTDELGRVATTNIANPVPPGLPAKFLPYANYRAWSMGILLAAFALHLDLDHAEFEPGRIVLHGPNGLARTIPLDADGYFYIDWAMTENDPHLTEGSLEDLLYGPIARANGQIVSNVWTNKLVVIGSTATGNELTDLGSTALESQTYLVTKHLNVANSVLTGRFMRLTPLLVNLLLIIGVGFFAAWITWAAAKPVQGSLWMLAFALVYLAAALLLFVEFRLWMPIVLPLFCAGFINHVLLVTYRARIEQSEKKRVKQLFSRLIAPDVVNEVLKLKSLQLSGVRREITVYFADVRGFTELTDTAQAQAKEYISANNLSQQEADAYLDAQAHEILSTVSAYLGTISDIIKQRKGTLDKYIGDCIMAFWGAPVPNPRHAVDAVRAAIAAQQSLASLNRNRQSQNKRREEENAARAKLGLPPHSLLPVLSLGTGINTGMAIVGYMGSESHVLNYTAVGREINLASRLEGVSGHGRIIIGEGTYLALLRDDPKLAAMCLEWPPRTVKGFRDAVRIYEVLWQPIVGAPQPPEENSIVTERKPTPA
jgi:class 3 adenylate cyclase